MSKQQIVHVPGSILNVAGDRSIAEVLATVSTIILFDRSSSMDTTDAPPLENSKLPSSRYDYAIRKLAAVQNQTPGKIAIVSFSDRPMFHPDGIPGKPSGTTDMADGLRFIQIADGCGIQFILISDGEPDDDVATLAIARQFETPIDTIYVGPVGGEGEDFLRRLSALTGGRSVTNAFGTLLDVTILQLMGN